MLILLQISVIWVILFICNLSGVYMEHMTCLFVNTQRKWMQTHAERPAGLKQVTKLNNSGASLEIYFMVHRLDSVLKFWLWTPFMQMCIKSDLMMFFDFLNWKLSWLGNMLSVSPMIDAFLCIKTLLIP